MQRNESLDALRGFAIFTMILSGSIAFGNTLPAWMYHAQLPPPLHQFNGKLPGITWVDLVFPFFLFSMGAAIPLALQKETNTWQVVLKTVKRFALLAFFALFFNHLKAWVISPTPTWKEQLISIGAFLLLILSLVKIKNATLEIVIKLGLLIVAVLLLYYLPFHKGKGFDFYKSDIIIMVLANMALFGTLIYWFTRNNPLIRVGILLFVMAFFLAAKEPNDSWTKTIFNWNSIGDYKIDWLYKFYFLKYLFIIIPGTIVGEWMRGSSQMGQSSQESQISQSSQESQSSQSSQSSQESQSSHMGQDGLGICLLVFYILFCNLYCLLNRYLFANVCITSILLFLLYYVVKKSNAKLLYKSLIQLGSYLLLLGLCFEAYEGGIKKDSSTYSYYFVTSGLACLILVFFDIAIQFFYVKWIIRQLALVGKNPLMAYMMGSLLLLPLLHLFNIHSTWDAMHTNAFVGFLKGLIFTVAICALTNVFTKYKIILKT